eukprot:SAG22_NODE_1771_length_3616_cov_7.362834_1_plen_57_part_00
MCTCTYPRVYPGGKVQPCTFYRYLPYIGARAVSRVQTDAQQLNFEPKISVLYLICG